MNDPWRERLSEHVDGELSPGEARELEAHLAACAACREAIADLRRIVAAARVLPDREPSRDLWPAIEPRLEPASGSEPARRTPWSGQRSPWSAQRYLKMSLVAAAAVVVALVVRFFLRDGGAASPSSPMLAQYLMLLHEPAGHMADATDEEIERVVDEYRRWAQAAAATGNLITGEKLADGWGWILGPDEQDSPPEAWRGSTEIGGFFVIAAASDGEARELARTCPHLRHDGWIELRPIEDENVPRPKNGR